MTKKQIILTALFLITIGITFSPIVIPYNITGPWFFSMPRTLWAGILSSIVLALITLLATFTIKTEDEEK